MALAAVDALAAHLQGREGRWSVSHRARVRGSCFTEAIQPGREVTRHAAGNVQQAMAVGPGEKDGCCRALTFAGSAWGNFPGALCLRCALGFGENVERRQLSAFVGRLLPFPRFCCCS